MSASISQRFQRIPSLQKEREAEYSRQASETEGLLRRLRETRAEAERAAKDEIEATRRMQVEEFSRHPDMLAWQRDIRETEGKVREWSRNAERRSQQLRELIAGLEQQLRRKQDELDRVQSELARSGQQEYQLRGQIAELESQRTALQGQLQSAIIDKDDISHHIQPAHADHLRLAKELEQLRAQKDEVSRQWEGLKGRETSLTTSRDTLNRELESLRGELGEWERRMAVIAEQIRKAEALFAEAQSMCQQHQAVLNQANQERQVVGSQVSQLLEKRTVPFP